MSMKLCRAQKHFYDEREYRDCPYCSEGVAFSAPKTQIIQSNQVSNVSGVVSPMPKTQIIQNAPKTTIIGMDNNQDELLPVVGWLIIVEGAGKGRDFRLIQGENRIGRSAQMEICLDFGANSDASVSRDTHACVVFDSQAGEFFVERGSSRNLPQLNGHTVRGEPILQAYDILQLGQTKLMFVPLCGAHFHW